MLNPRFHSDDNMGREPTHAVSGKLTYYLELL